MHTRRARTPRCIRGRRCTCRCPRSDGCLCGSATRCARSRDEPRTIYPGPFCEDRMEPHQPLLHARDLMERDVITVTPETRILDVHRLLVEEAVSTQGHSVRTAWNPASHSFMRAI